MRKIAGLLMVMMIVSGCTAELAIDTAKRLWREHEESQQQVAENVANFNRARRHIQEQKRRYTSAAAMASARKSPDPAMPVETRRQHAGIPAGTIPLRSPEFNHRHYKVGGMYHIKGKKYVPETDPDYMAVGKASWYGDPFHGRLTGNGEIFDKELLTAAHKTLPMPSIVRVTNLENGKSVLVRINDRGPFVDDRIIDVSEEAAKRLGFYEQGVARVKVEKDQRRTAALFGDKIPEGIVLAENDPTASPVPIDFFDGLKDMDARHSVLGSKTMRETIPKLKDSKHYIQTASFHSSDNAHLSAQQLAMLGPVDVHRASVSGRPYYRVRLGPFSEENQAKTTLNNVVELGYPDAKIVSK